MWNFSGIIYSKRYDEVVDLSLPMWEAEWFKGSLLNYAENIVKYRDDKVALIAAGEDKETRRITYAELYKESCRYAAAFRKAGLKKGDVVACYMSNRPEPVYAMIGAVSVGALWTGVFPFFGADAVVKNLFQLKPKFLLTIDRFLNNNEEINMLPKVEEISKGLCSLESVIIVPSKESSKLKAIGGIRNGIFLDDFLADDTSTMSIQFEQLSFSHPVFVTFTSGTTGLPKAVMHNSGILLSILRDAVVHSDSDRESVWHGVSPVGGPAWVLYATVLSSGCGVLLFEGEPYWYRPNYMPWDMVDEYDITHLYLPASVLDEIEKRGQIPSVGRNHLRSLKVLLAGGSVVKPKTYEFVYENLPKKVMFSSVFGCTELIGSCLIMESTLPIYRGEIPAFTLGNEVKAIDDDGKEVIGELGHLVLTTPTPNLMIGLWGDHDRSVLKQKYFSKHEDMYSIGDYGIINPVTRGTVIYCRSDETLIQRGCRFGSSEIYDIVDRFPEIHDSFCVSHYNKNMDARAVLFLRMRAPYRFDEAIRQKVREAITRELTVRHVPDVILETQDIPMNINGKKMEIAVKGMINNLPYNTETCANPESLKYYINIPELQEF